MLNWRGSRCLFTLYPEQWTRNYTKILIVQRCPLNSLRSGTRKWYVRWLSDNEDLIKYIGDNSQIPNFDLDKLWMVYDNLFCMLQHTDAHKWPSWINASVFDRVQDLYDGYSRTKYHTDVLRRLRGGALLKDILDRFVAKANGSLGVRPKLFAYSAHDTTLAAMLASLGIYPTVFPRYASAVLLELHRKDGELIVQVFHKNGTDIDDLYYYEIPGCGDPCTLDALRLAVDRYLPTDWTTECGLAGPNVMNYIVSTAILACSTTLLAGILLLDIMLRKKRRYNVTNDPLIANEEEP
ncbi:hypothetical protein KIN20_030276 [Parelaphostrongylus tenuis]|uniref:Lysosomal acid phosphatase n=1 Tax=Parelaphostrongylus tenuis TaxID=148309 RepID=A0AAD5WG72_PARTN|nr:hypothetical protein KIN20_030276 [Parelaphostrongylus tenuis]